MCTVEEALEALGARVVRVPGGAEGRGVDLAAAFAALWALGYRSAMVEGGAGIITALLMQPSLVARVVVTVAPVWVGGVRCVDRLLAEEMRARVESVEVEKAGDDVVVFGEVSLHS